MKSIRSAMPAGLAASICTVDQDDVERFEKEADFE
jgi:hypothetical protein